jgi:S-adenosylmethionine-diacylglycerol 3-amino-3-carboxypropyl transferase
LHDSRSGSSAHGAGTPIRRRAPFKGKRSGEATSNGAGRQPRGRRLSPFDSRPRQRFADRVFGSLFSRILVYTILFEDNEKDLEFLALDGDSRVFTVGGAGCGVAAMLASSPALIDVVDFNQKHLAVTALKVNAARGLASYEEFHELLARGRHPRPRRTIERFTRDLPPELARFWAAGWKMFRKGFYSHGLYSRNLGIVRPFWPLTPDYLRELNGKSADERSREVFELLSRSMQGPVLGALIRSPLSILAAGINYTQRERNLRAVGSDDVVDGVIEFASRVARTDLEENWIAWHIVTGSFNHDRPGALPLYLRPEYHERTLHASTEMRYSHAVLLDRLREGGEECWSHFCLSDVVDWINEEGRIALFDAVHRAALPGARVICRSVEDSTIVDDIGFGDRFRLVEPFSTDASLAERSCLYRRVNCYEVVK